MSSPIGPNAGPVTSTVPTAGVDEAVRSADRLGLTWKLRPASVQYPPSSDPTAVSVLLDGDAAGVLAYSLVGIVQPEARVMTLHVPPSGVYITGFVSLAATETVAGVRVSDNSGGEIIHTTSTNVEATIPQMTLTNVSVVTGNLYAFQGSVAVNGGGSGTSFIFRWRKGNSSGIAVAAFIYLPGGTGFDDTKAFDCTYRPSASDTDTYVLTVQRQAGLVGDLNVYGTKVGDPLTTHARLTHLGSYTRGASLFLDN